MAYKVFFFLSCLFYTIYIYSHSPVVAFESSKQVVCFTNARVFPVGMNVLGLNNEYSSL
jgi:hypothetical protein